MIIIIWNKYKIVHLISTKLFNINSNNNSYVL